MTDRSAGAPPALTLDGVHLTSLHPDGWTIRPRELSEVTEAADGTLVKRMAYRLPEAGALDPIEIVKHDIELTVGHAREGGGLLDRLLAAPDPHRAIAYKRVVLAYRSDGATTVYRLPWPLALHAVDSAGAALTPPGLPDWSGYAPEVRLSPTAAPLAWASVTQATWDAGSPPADTTWVLDAAPYLQLDAAPPSGTVVTVSAVPELTVLRGAPAERRYQSPLREPRRVLLREA